MHEKRCFIKAFEIRSAQNSHYETEIKNKKKKSNHNVIIRGAVTFNLYHQGVHDLLGPLYPSSCTLILKSNILLPYWLCGLFHN